MPRVGIVHPGSLVGRELRERLARDPELGADLALLAVDENEVGSLTELAGSAALVGRLDPEDPGPFDLLIFTGTRQRDRPVWERLPDALEVLVVSRDADSSDGMLALPGRMESRRPGLRRWVVPQPGVVALVTLLDHLAELSWQKGFAFLTLPASSVSDASLDHLFEEARAILNFSKVPRSDRFAAQLAFNVLPAPEIARESERQLRRLLDLDAGRFTMGAAHAGVFHGLAAFLHLDLLETTTVEVVEAALLGSDSLTYTRSNPLEASPVVAAREENLIVGPIQLTDSGTGLDVWFAMDNLVRGQVATAVALARQMLGCSSG